MRILSFDTTSTSGGAALSRDGEVLGEQQASGSANYSIQLFQMTNRLLAAAGSRLADVELFAAATGPGSFTGIRVGLAAAQGWARALGRPVRGVSVFEAMLVQADLSGTEIAVPLLDARRGEFYLGVFRGRAQAAAGSARANRWIQQGDGLVLDASHIVALTSDLHWDRGRGPALVFRENDKAARDLCEHLSAERGPAAHTMSVPDFLPGAIARVAMQAAGEGCLQRPEDLDAYYIRRSDAELNWRE